jgi:hypothetical protein
LGSFILPQAGYLNSNVMPLFGVFDLRLEIMAR